MDILNKILEGGHIPAGTPGFDKIGQIVSENTMLEQDFNYNSHTNEERREILSKITRQEIDPTTQIAVPFHTDFGPHIFLGKHCFINKNSMFVDLGGVYFGDYVLVGPNVTFASLNHTIDPEHRWEINSASVHIGDNVWIGANATILPGVHIGKNAIVGAGSVVTKDVAENTIFAGSPARFLKTVTD
ncbi:DapH/DapD/GlmU-related protein [Leuconostoc miyukkimchii]|uniref:DapH/DapD/GlmU-related protein n=1 Tax=Leuconostoc miyukkimchii TaxID=910540 RepID=UPI001C7DD9AE|nr:DapH/DapD/GlmU-related protein [Leuconostoc miyukkimchii]